MGVVERPPQVSQMTVPFNLLSAHATPMLFTLPMQGVPGRKYQRAWPLLCAAPAVHSPPKRGLREKGEAKTAKSKNGHAGWNPGTARPVRHGANQSALHQGAAV